ncbi:hypothetical protein BamMC406_2308 [Burkholderia ambifaria MC40-6]|uniref:Uncharacterized protein n=1 Tax=Burkholderia ambifaria (strain MC40-6) TaxID=398577 RepID=B1YUP1_BURA4|nr:hypothetical protein BamMC406_2308 [Burkholderia ambifaria MC40-6]
MRPCAAGGFPAGPDHGIIRGLHAGRTTAARLHRPARPPSARAPGTIHAPPTRRAAPHWPRTVVPEIQVGVVSCRRGRLPRRGAACTHGASRRREIVNPSNYRVELPRPCALP